MTDASAFDRAREDIPKGQDWPKFRNKWEADLRRSGLSSSTKIVGWCLAAHVNRKTGETFIGLKRIQEDTGLARSTVVTAIGHLERNGFIVCRRGRQIRQTGKREPNRYTLRLATTVRLSDRSKEISPKANGPVWNGERSDFGAATVRESDSNYTEPESKPSKRSYSHEAKQKQEAERRLVDMISDGDLGRGYEALQSLPNEVYEDLVAVVATGNEEKLLLRLECAFPGNLNSLGSSILSRLKGPLSILTALNAVPLTRSFAT